jgi:heme/copper-type cytochrome/quinol oxidase subunit 3
VTELAQEAILHSALEREAPAVMERNLRIAARLWSSATAFFFFAFLFAYFYLRSLNQQGLWHPKHVDPPVALGTIQAVSVVLAAVLLRDALRHRRAGRLDAWRIRGVVTLVLLIAAIGVQIAGWATQGFGPTDGSFASVYIGWTSFELFFLVGLFYWVETTLATSLRHRGQLEYHFGPGEASGDPNKTSPDIHDPLSLVPAQLEATSFFGTVVAVVVVVSWIVLYLL